MRITIKLGTSTLTAGSGALHVPTILDLVRQIVAARQRGAQVVLVSSGAVAAGRAALGWPSLPKHVPQKQMLSAIGQPRLMQLYGELFGHYGVQIAQVLLTRADLENRRRYLNARNTLDGLLQQNVLPIVNENDTVATEEIRVGDNDQLSALVANLLQSEQLLLLTDQAGLFERNPRAYPDAQLIEEISGPSIADSIWQAAGASAGNLGTGGMLTKLRAAEQARRMGCMVLIADGREPEVIARASSGALRCTRILASRDARESRKRFLLAVPLSGKVSIDAGAGQALSRGSSLLPVGIRSIQGEFERGDLVSISHDGVEMARGLASYSANELSQLCGLRSEDIEAKLGYTRGEVAIHRDDLVLL